MCVISNAGEFELMRKDSGNFVHTNSEIVRFINDYKLTIFKACKDAWLRKCDWEIVENDMAIKYAQGHIEYDPTRGAKANSYYYKIAWNCAKDQIRKQLRFVELDDKEIELVFDEHDQFAQMANKDKQLHIREAIRRLAKEMHDMRKVEILCRYVFGETREKLAKEYGIDNDYISLVRTRYLPRLQQLLIKVQREDEEGKLKIGNFSEISFLKKHIKNL